MSDDEASIRAWEEMHRGKSHSLECLATALRLLDEARLAMRPDVDAIFDRLWAERAKAPHNGGFNDGVLAGMTELMNAIRAAGEGKPRTITVAETNAERIEAIIAEHYPLVGGHARSMARRIVEAFPELRPAQQTMERDGTTRTIAEPLPWAER